MQQAVQKIFLSFAILAIAIGPLTINERATQIAKVYAIHNSQLPQWQGGLMVFSFFCTCSFVIWEIILEPNPPGFVIFQGLLFPIPGLYPAGFLLNLYQPFFTWTTGGHTVVPSFNCLILTPIGCPNLTTQPIMFWTGTALIAV